ncbi:unnamed protein product [Urochloa humidicola]
MSSPPGSSPAPELPVIGMAHLALQNLQVEDQFLETCRRDSFCLSCNHAFCSHCCFYHHVHSGANVVVKIDLDSTGRPIFPTHTSAGHRIMQCMVEEMMSAADYTSRLARDAFCLHCGKAFCSDLCSHHDHSRRGLPDAVVRVEERGGGRHCVRCTGAEWWWTSHIYGCGSRRPGPRWGRRARPVLRAAPGAEV